MLIITLMSFSLLLSLAALFIAIDDISQLSLMPYAAVSQLLSLAD
jgi:hypothetical protein